MADVSASFQVPIVGFEQDELGDWIAKLACGHQQHVRHAPPLRNRPWVLTEAGRAQFLGAKLPCKHCRENMTKTPLDPLDFDVPAGFTHWPGDMAEDNMGPFFYRMTETHCQSALRLQPKHCNIYGKTHGGILMSLADYTLGLTAIGQSDAMWVTVTCSSEFVASSEAGELVVGTGELVRRTKSMAFVRATLRVGERIVLTASGVFKKVGRS